MTVDIFTLLARYTVHANDEMGKILQNLSPEEWTRDMGGLILHVFNHGTHHRGMIALYLDQMKRSNDFNGIMAVL
jgi:uncharacterized damage-inducible protein DinB